jgi:hypothetical protein
MTNHSLCWWVLSFDGIAGVDFLPLEIHFVIRTSRRRRYYHLVNFEDRIYLEGAMVVVEEPLV